jgi:hypothetical protein
MNSATPPLDFRRLKFERLAQASWLSIVIGFVVNLLLRVGFGPVKRPEDAITNAILTGCFVLFGVVSGIIVLCAVPRYGHKKLLWPALTGILLWLSCFAVAVPTLLSVWKLAHAKPTTLHPVKHSPGAKRVEDAEMHFSFDLPDGFKPYPPAAKPAKYRYAFLRKIPNDLGRVLLVQALDRPLPILRAKPREMPAAVASTLTTFDWRGLDIDGFRVSESVNGIKGITFNVQIPLRQRALQLGFGGPAEAEPELRALAEQVLSTLEGENSR